MQDTGKVLYFVRDFWCRLKSDSRSCVGFVPVVLNRQQSGRILSNESYISLDPEDDEFTLTGVMCYIKTEEQKEVIKTLTTDQIIVVKGKITDVGEVFGYYLDIDSVAAE